MVTFHADKQPEEPVQNRALHLDSSLLELELPAVAVQPTVDQVGPG